MSEYITHTAILDDCFRLMQASSNICPEFQFVATMQGEIAHLGAITRSGDQFTVSLLQSLRERWAERKPEQRLEQKLAFVLGWLCHRAADRQMKPVFREAHPPETRTAADNPTECSVYHDVYVFQEIYNRGQERPFEPGMLEQSLHMHAAATAINVEAFESLFRTVFQRTLLSLHTFIPDREDIEGWFDRLFALRQDYTISLERYAAIFAQPDPVKMQRYIIEMNFYDKEEPLIRLARALQNSDELQAQFVHEALNTEPKCHYAQALGLGLGYLHAASDFFVGKINEETLRERLYIGKAGRDGKYV